MVEQDRKEPELVRVRLIGERRGAPQVGPETEEADRQLVLRALPRGDGIEERPARRRLRRRSRRLEEGAKRKRVLALAAMPLEDRTENSPARLGLRLGDLGARPRPPPD